MLSNLFTRFAAAEDTGPAVHIAPAEVFQIGNISITNSMLYGWICAIFIIALLVYAARKITIKPKGGAMQFLEVGAEFIIKTVESGFDDKSRARKYVPYFVTLFFFLLINNWLGLLPGVGEAVTIGESPMFRPFTGDLNATLAAGVITMGYVYISSVREAGSIGKYLRHFFVGSPLNPMYLVLGLLEILTDLTRVISLSLRLFLNVAIGEIVIAVFAYLGQGLAPLTAMPFTLIEILVGALQAYIFVILSVMYLAISVNNVSHHEEEDLTEGDVPETMEFASKPV